MLAGGPVQPHAGVNYIPQSGTMNLATGDMAGRQILFVEIKI
jgi:hypothetical protein